MIHENRNYIIKGLILCMMLVFLPEKTIYADGNINSNEAEVLETLEGEFTYDGSVYVVDSAYKEALYAYFAEDGVDLTESEKEECLSEIAGNIGQAVSEGYMIKVGTALNEEKADAAEEKEDSSVKKKKKSESSTKATTQPKELTEEEKAQLREKWKTQIDDIEEKADNIRNRESINQEDISNALGNSQASTEENISSSDTEYNIETEDKNKTEIEHKIPEQKQNLVYKVGHELRHNLKYIVIIALGIAASAAVFYIGLRIRRRKSVLNRDDYTDIHSHILPGVDDGAKNMETTKKMLYLAQKQGIHTIIATPHYKIGQQKATVEQLQEIQKLVQQEAKKEGIDIEILLGNELYYSRDICNRLDEKKALTLAGTRYVLVEFSPNGSYTELYQGLRELIQGGYVPILAHMERYQCLHKNKNRKKIQELIELGIYMQMNIQSLHRGYCRRLVKDGYIHFLASDSHNTKERLPKMQDGITALGNMVTKEQMEKILVENPKMLREDKYIR